MGHLSNGPAAGADLAGVAERLRAVKDAERRFLRLWRIEQEVILPGLDRVAADVAGAPAPGGSAAAAAPVTGRDGPHPRPRWLDRGPRSDDVG